MRTPDLGYDAWHRKQCFCKAWAAANPERCRRRCGEAINFQRQLFHTKIIRLIGQPTNQQAESKTLVEKSGGKRSLVTL